MSGKLPVMYRICIFVRLGSCVCSAVASFFPDTINDGALSDFGTVVLSDMIEAASALTERLCISLGGSVFMRTGAEAVVPTDDPLLCLEIVLFLNRP